MMCIIKTTFCLLGAALVVSTASADDGDFNPFPEVDDDDDKKRIEFKNQPTPVTCVDPGVLNVKDIGSSSTVDFNSLVPCASYYDFAPSNPGGVKAMVGSCINVDSQECVGEDVQTGFCKGAANIKCCPKPALTPSKGYMLKVGEICPEIASKLNELIDPNDADIQAHVGCWLTNDAKENCGKKKCSGYLQVKIDGAGAPSGGQKESYKVMQDCNRFADAANDLLFPGNPGSLACHELAGYDGASLYAPHNSTDSRYIGEVGESVGSGSGSGSGPLGCERVRNKINAYIKDPDSLNSSASNLSQLSYAAAVAFATVAAAAVM